MALTTVISANIVKECLGHDNWGIIDYRFSLANPEADAHAYRPWPFSQRPLCPFGQ